MSEIPDFYQKNRAALERAFINFSQDATLVQSLAGGETEETPIQVIISHRNPLTFEAYTGFEVEMKILQRDAPNDLAVNDEIRIERNGELFTIDSISNEIVTARVECTKN